MEMYNSLCPYLNLLAICKGKNYECEKNIQFAEQSKKNKKMDCFNCLA